MFLKSLKICGRSGVIRLISFRAGLNLIVDETATGAAKESGNNVGKTTVLKLIDFCLGASAKGIYTDPEDRRSEYAAVKEFLLTEQVIITLTMGENMTSASESDVVVERNFLPRKNLIRRINGVARTEDEFEEELTNRLFPGHYGKKPTFAQIISHNIRYKELSVTQTLRTLDKFTRNEEYETLYLFLLGCDFTDGDAKQALSVQLRIKSAFKARLESKQTRSAYEASLALLMDEIGALNTRRNVFQVNSELEDELKLLGELRYEKSVVGSRLAQNRLRLSLVTEAVDDISSKRADIDVEQLRALYLEVSSSLDKVSKSFADLLDFHNKMIDEKARYLAKERPHLLDLIAEGETELRALVEAESSIAARISDSGTLHDLEEIILSLNDRHRLRGEHETVIGQIRGVEDTIDGLKGQLAAIDHEIFSVSFEARIQLQLKKLNRHFSSVSQQLYGERYAIKVDRVPTKTGQQVYQFTSFNTNFSSGKKQGEITCFDIAYTLFADEENIPCYHFLLNDKKELMHDNQLAKIGSLVNREKGHIQYIASILRDKLPPELNDERFIVLKLSQSDKLFRIESGASDERATVPFIAP